MPKMVKKLPKLQNMFRKYFQGHLGRGRDRQRQSWKLFILKYTGKICRWDLPFVKYNCATLFLGQLHSLFIYASSILHLFLKKHFLIINHCKRLYFLISLKSHGFLNLLGVLWYGGSILNRWWMTGSPHISF